MKKILMIAYYYPPIINVGVNRTLNFSINLEKLGYEPVILTIKDPDSRLCQLGKKIPKNIKIYRTKSLKFKYTLINKQIDMLVGWIPFAVKKGLEIIKNEKIDLIYVSCPPWSSSIAAAILKKLTGKPLIVDFRDGWTTNPYKDVTIFDKILEKFVLRNADLVITTTKDTEEQYREKFPNLKLRTIYNGTDKLRKSDPDKKEFIISYFGTYAYGRTPVNLFKAIKALDKKIKKRIRFVSFSYEDSYSRFIKKLAKKYDVDITLINNPSNRGEIEKYLKKSSMFLLLQARTNKRENAIPYKTYEYLSTGKPILADIPKGDIIKILNENGKTHIISNNDSEGYKIFTKAIEETYKKWKKEKLKPKIKKSVKKFLFENLTKELAEELDSLTKYS